MSRNNDVFKVLVTEGDKAVLAANNQVTDLAPGQIGVFDFETNLSVDSTNASKVRNFYLAVGLDLDGDGVTDDIMKSSGSHIQKKNNVFYSYRPHTPGQPMKVLVKDYTADCETEYGIKLEMRNQEIYRTQGYNQFTKTYSIVTSCCNGCEPTCPSGDANEITRKLMENINSDPNGLVQAQAVARTAIPAAEVTGLSGDLEKGDVVNSEDLAAIMAYNATQADPEDYFYTDLEITTVTQAIERFCSVNLKYFYPRETVVIPSKIEGFKCNGEIEIIQQATFEEGKGYDVQQMEYKADGWRTSPYRLSTLNGVARGVDYFAKANENYDLIALTYDQFSIGAWLEYLNNEATIIAIPAEDTTTRDGLIGILDEILEPLGFNTLADDALDADTDPTVVEKTEDKGVDKDGLA